MNQKIINLILDSPNDATIGNIINYKKLLNKKFSIDDIVFNNSNLSNYSINLIPTHKITISGMVVKTRETVPQFNSRKFLYVEIKKK